MYSMIAPFYISYIMAFLATFFYVMRRFLPDDASASATITSGGRQGAALHDGVNLACS